MADFPTFWQWLLRSDRDGDRGLSNIVNIWLLIHFVIAAVLAFVLTIDVGDLATKVAIPGAAILVGLSFAWAGRSASLFQDKAFSEFILDNGAPIEGYLYSFQLAILVVLIFLLGTFFVFAGGTSLSSGSAWLDNVINRFTIIWLGSIALRECWGSIYFVNKLTIQFYAVRANEIANLRERADQ